MNRLHRFDTLTAWFGEYMTIVNYRPRTIKDYLFELSFFRRYIERQSDKEDIDDFDAEMLRNYAADLYNKNNAPKTIHHKLGVLKSFFKALYNERKLYIDLSETIQLPKVGKSLPTNVLTEEETKALFDYLETSTEHLNVQSFEDALLCRDRAIFEVLYSTGIRRTELLTLRLCSVNYADGLVTVTDGKGGKDRVVPIGGASLDAVDRYVRVSRSKLASIWTKDELFLNRFGGPLSHQGLRNIVNKTLTVAGISKRIRIHDMRHTCATHMLNHGADIRYVQEMLGHASLSSTQVYTHVSINKLKETHDKFHPRESNGESSSPSTSSSQPKP